MRKQYKPGPKSRSRSEKKVVSLLGDVDSEDSPAEATEAFRAPEADSNVTDYGFEFTSVQSPGRTSTVRVTRLRDSVASRVRTSTRTPVQSPFEHHVTASTSKQAAAATVASKQKARIAKPRNTRKQHAPSKLDTIILRDIIRLQKSTAHLIPRLPFSRVIRELIYSTSSQVERITPEALEALQCAGEMYIIQRLQDAYLLTLHRGRVTLSVNDLRIIAFLRQHD